MEFCKDDETFEVDMGNDVFKVLLRCNRPYPQSVIRSLARDIANEKICFLPSGIDVIVVVNDGTVKKY